MSHWAEVAASAPEFADSVRRIFESRRHKTLATLRKDGSPRVSGIELSFVEGDVVMGMMPGSLKSLDPRRDPRMACTASRTTHPLTTQVAGRAT